MGNGNPSSVVSPSAPLNSRSTFDCGLVRTRGNLLASQVSVLKGVSMLEKECVLGIKGRM